MAGPYESPVPHADRLDLNQPRFQLTALFLPAYAGDVESSVRALRRHMDDSPPVLFPNLVPLVFEHRLLGSQSDLCLPLQLSFQCRWALPATERCIHALCVPGLRHLVQGVVVVDTQHARVDQQISLSRVDPSPFISLARVPSQRCRYDCPRASSDRVSAA